MEKKMHFYMKLSNDEDIEFTVYGQVLADQIKFSDLNNVEYCFTISNDMVTLKRDAGFQKFIMGEKTSTVYRYDQNLVLNIDIFTEFIEYKNNILKINFENYVNGQFTNKHELTLVIAD